MLARGWAAVALALLPMVVCAQGAPSAIARVGADTVLVGKPFEVRVTVLTAGGAVILPAVVDTGGPVEALDPPALSSRADTAIVRWRLVAWEAGEQALPVGPVVLRRPGVPDTSLAVNTIVRVTSVLPADTALRIPREARDDFAFEQPWWMRLLPWLAGAALLALVLYSWWSRRGKAGRRRDDVAPGLAARAALDRLGERNLAVLGEPTRHAVLAVDILRDFLARADARCARSLTTTELGDAARDAFGETGKLVQSVLTRVDALRFGAVRLDAGGAEAIERDVRVIVTRVEQLQSMSRGRGRAA